MKKILSYDTAKKNEIIPVTKDINKIVEESKIKNGTLFAYSLHTTLSLIIQEAIEPNLCQDFVEQLTKAIDDNGHSYNHTCAKHPSGTCRTDSFNGPSHVRQLLTNQPLVLDISNGKVNLGQWQDIAVFELDGPRPNRKILVKIIKD